MARGKVRDLETEVREYINEPRIHHGLYRNDLKAFNVVCSSLDVIGDTTMAIDSYGGLEEPGDFGVSYLMLYGLLQAFFIQQDAAEHILEALGITCAASRENLLYIREIRNMASGHPTKREGKPKKNIPPSSHGITRCTLHLKGFALLSYPATGDVEITDVSVTELIEKQESGIAAILEAALEQLRKREEEHRMKFRDHKLAALFHDQIEYYIEKCYEGCRSDDENGRRSFALVNVELLADILSKFRADLTEREVLPSHSHVEMELADADYPLCEFGKFLRGDAASTLNEKSARIFVFYLQHQFRKLRQYAQDIDKGYMEEPQPVDNSVPPLTNKANSGS